MTARWIKPTITFALVALAVWQVGLLLAVLHSPTDIPDVDTATVRRGPFIVGISREGTIESADVISIRAPRSGSTLTWVIEDGVPVKKGDLIAKVDVSDYQFEVERHRLQQQDAVRRISQEERDRTRDHESAQATVEEVLRAFGVLTRSQLMESEQTDAQISFDQWNLTWSQKDYEKQSRLSQAGIVPVTTVEQSERTLRSREYGLAKSEKDASYLDAEHASQKRQSEADIDTAEFNADLAERSIGQSVASARERAQLAAQQLAEMESELSAGELRAPTDGVVVLGKTWGEAGRRALKEGDRIWRRMTVAQITDLAELQAVVRVDENSIQGVKVGQVAAITLRAAPGREFLGEVVAIGAVAHEVDLMEDPTAVPGQRVFDVTVAINKRDPELMRPGVKAEVQFVTERIPDVSYIPVSAIFERHGAKTAYVARNGTFLPRQVKTGARNDKWVVITDGLKPGETVALSDPTRTGAG
jgi:RND family efflux transporter MFP subunit